jgi:hypothetical protein
MYDDGCFWRLGVWDTAWHGFAWTLALEHMDIEQEEWCCCCCYS